MTDDSVEFEGKKYRRDSRQRWYSPLGERKTSLEPVLEQLWRQRRDKAIWIGDLNGDTVVFDPTFSASDESVVSLWSLTRDRFLTIDRATARSAVRTATDEAVRTEVISKFRLSLVVRHRRRIEKLGRQYEGVETTGRDRKRRQTNCYSCKEALDNAVDVTCTVCGWILCRCGACGCGYER